MSSRYPIPGGRHRVEIVERRSRFIATVDHTPCVEAAKTLVDACRRESPDATHHVYAYAVGYGASVTHGMSDAGEPSGTAGRPTLAVIQASGLGDICVVTARYFGGTKLGTGGLVRAYTRAAREVIAGVTLSERVERRVVRVTIGYALYERLSQLLAAHGGQILSESFLDMVSMRAELPADRLPDFERALAEATSGQVTADIEEPETR